MSEKMGFFILKSDKLKKDISGLWPFVEIATTLVCCGGKILSVYNDRWGAFTLPMSKRRRWQDPRTKEEAERVEDWDDAAVRVAAEWLGHTLTDKPRLLTDLAEFQQSDRDERWKRYHVQVFQVDAQNEKAVAPNRIVEWLLPDQIVDEERRPISPTARYIISELKLKGIF